MRRDRDFACFKPSTISKTRKSVLEIIAMIVKVSCKKAADCIAIFNDLGMGHIKEDTAERAKHTCMPRTIVHASESASR